MTMPGEGIDVPLNLDTADYVQGIQAAIAPTTALAQAVGQVHSQAQATRGIWDYVTPSRVAIAGMTAMTANAAAMQHELSGLHATQVATGQSAAALAAGERALARELPGGQHQANQLVQTYQQLGLTRRNQVTQIRELSKASVELGAATGENTVQLAAQTMQLDRQFNVTSPQRVKAMNDSLVSVQKNVGGTASGILSFADAITPFAKQAGLGETAVLGISGAFSKLGADGYGATTAISKVIQDLNKSVRDGSNEMQGYANAVGMTRNEFSQLYKQNPAEALSRVITSLGRPGPESQRNLESLGFEGVRTQRYLAEVAQSGNIGGAIAEARRGYGSGVTEKAAHAAFNNLQDDLSKLAATSLQTSEAIGTPFLGALQNITHIAGAFAGVTARLAGNRIVQDLLHIASYGALAVGGGALLARAGARGLMRGGTLAMGYSMLTRGPVRGAVAGFGGGRGAALGLAPFGIGTRGLGADMARHMAIQEEMLNLGYSPAQARAAAPMGGHLTGPASEHTYGFGARMGQRYEAWRLSGMSPQEENAYRDIRSGAVAPPQGLKMRQRLWRGIATPVSLGYEGVMRSMVQTPAMEALAPLGAQGANRATGLFADLRDEQKRIWGEYTKSDMGPAAYKKMTREWTTAVGDTRKELKALGGEFGALRRSTRATAGAMGSVGRFGMQAGRGSLSAIGGAIGGMLPGLAITGAIAGGTALVGALHHNMQRSAEEEQRTREEGNFATLDKYNDSLGLANQSTMTLSDSFKETAKTLEAAVKTVGDAVKVTSQDVSYARSTSSQVVYPFTKGSTTQGLTAQAALIGGTEGLTPQQVQAIKLDMLRQGYDSHTVTSALGALPTTGNRTRPVTMAQVTQSINASGLPASMPPAMRRSGAGGGSDKGHRGQWDVQSPVSDVGSSFHPVKATKEVTAQVDAIAEVIQQRYEANVDMYGEDYAMQQEEIDMQQAVQAAVDSGHSDDYIVTMTRKFGTMLNIKGAGSTSIGRSDINKRGGFIQSVTHHHGNAAPVIAHATGPVGGTAADVRPTRQLGALPASFQNAGINLSAPGARLFDNRQNPTAGSRAIVQAQQQPDNPVMTRQFTNAFIADVTGAGKSMSAAADTAAQLAAAIDQDTNPAFQRLIATMQEAQSRAQTQAQQSGSGGQMRVRLQGDRAMMNRFRNSSSEAGQAAFEGAKQDVRQAQQDFYSMLQQRLSAQREYQVSVQRSTEDFHRSQARAEEDFNLSMSRSQEDYQLQTARANEDYLIGRNRQFRDYNIQLERQAEDAAKTMLSPYERLGTEQIWSTQDLLQNAARQNEQMQQQLANLRKAQKMGLSQQSIDWLGLADPKNAQQLAQTINDMLSDPSLARQLNSTASSRQTLSGALFGQGVDYRRQKEDFERNLSDQSADFHKSMGRTEDDFHRAMSRANADYQRQLQRSEQDFQLSMQRAHEDIMRSDQEISGDMQTLLDMTEKALHGQTVVWGNTISNGVQDTVDAVKGSVTDMNDWLVGQGWTPPAGVAAASASGNASGDLNPRSKNNATGHTYSEQANKQIGQQEAAKYGWNSGAEWTAINELVNQESGWNNYAQNPKSTAYGIGQFLNSTWAGTGYSKTSDPKSQIDAMYVYIKKRYGDPIGAWEHEQNVGWYAQGSIFNSPRQIGVGENGSEAVIPLNDRGVGFLAAAFGRAIGFDDYRAMSANAAATHIHYHHEQISVDHSTHFSGDIKIEGVTDLDELARRAEERVARDNFTAAVVTHR